jgi:tRNA (guanine6-N2)-methyltransferase
MTRRFFVRVVRGLEWIAAAEIEALPGTHVTRTEHRVVHFEARGDPLRLRSLSIVDDLFVTCAELDGLDHTRQSLERLERALGKVPTVEALRLAAAVRHCPSIPRAFFEVVASFLGRRNYNRFEIENAAGRALARHVRATYCTRRDGKPPRADLSFRLHLVGRQALLGLRLFERPLHRRDFKLASRTGSLHPPVAAAMVALAGLQAGTTLTDPFCGVGTIVIEALRRRGDSEAVGLDINDKSVRNTRENAVRAGVAVLAVCGDAGLMPFAAASFQCCVSNLPWQRQIQPSGSFAQHGTKFWSELGRILTPHARAVILTAQPPSAEDLYLAGLVSALAQPVNISGYWATIHVLLRPERTAFTFEPANALGKSLKHWYGHPSRRVDRQSVGQWRARFTAEEASEILAVAGDVQRYLYPNDLPTLHQPVERVGEPPAANSPANAPPFARGRFWSE